MRLSEYIIEKDWKILDVIQYIDKNRKGIVYITENEKLIASVTDGDIRRYLLKKGDMEKNILKIANKSPVYLKKENENKVEDTLKKYQIRSLPIVDDEKRIIKIYFDKEYVEREKEKLDLPVIIMAGGKGTRLYPYTQILPKPLIPIGEKTITEHIMERFQKYYCKEFHLVVNYKRNFIQSYFQEFCSSYKMNFWEEINYLGTGGGLKLLENVIQKTCFVSNCDILVDADYAEIINYHRKEKNIVTMIGAEKLIKIPYGIIETKEKNSVIKIREKPNIPIITNTGLYVIEPEFVKIIPDNEFIHMTDLIERCIEKGKKVGLYTVKEDKWLDMGQLDELNHMKEKLGVD